MDTFNIDINKINSNQEVDFDKLPDNAQRFIIEYGLRQILNDAHSQCIVKNYDDMEELKSDVESAIKAKLGALQSGEITTRRATHKPADPIEAEAIKIAREAVKAKLAANDMTLKSVGSENVNKLVDQYLDKYGDATRKEAKKRVEAMNKADDIDLDLSDLV